MEKPHWSNSRTPNGDFLSIMKGHENHGQPDILGYPSRQKEPVRPPENHLQEVYGFERKYLIKLLTGERTYHPHPGRGCTYGPEFARYALKLHEACKYLCAPYFRVRLPTLIKDWEAIKGTIPTDVKNQLLKASESTFARLFRKFPHDVTSHGKCDCPGRIYFAR